MRRNGHSTPLFGPYLLWRNGWMDQDTNWYGGRPRPRRHCARWGLSCPSPTFQPMSIVTKRSPISVTADLLLHSSRQSVIEHIGASCSIRLNLSFLWCTQLHNPNDKPIASAVFIQLTAESPYTLQWALLSHELPLPTHGWIWTPSNT